MHASRARSTPTIHQRSRHPMQRRRLHKQSVRVIVQVYHPRSGCSPRHAGACLRGRWLPRRSQSRPFCSSDTKSTYTAKRSSPAAALAASALLLLTPLASTRPSHAPSAGKKKLTASRRLCALWEAVRKGSERTEARNTITKLGMGSCRFCGTIMPMPSDMATRPEGTASLYERQWMEHLAICEGKPESEDPSGRDAFLFLQGARLECPMVGCPSGFRGTSGALAGHVAIHPRCERVLVLPDGTKCGE